MKEKQIKAALYINDEYMGEVLFQDPNSGNLELEIEPKKIPILSTSINGTITINDGEKIILLTLLFPNKFKRFCHHLATITHRIKQKIKNIL